ncbi:hypothetical protein MBLNU13_g04969t1 [Cladosporium sp. NU13]
MAEGPLRFRTPHIEEIPTANSRHQPGFAWVAVKKDAADPSKAALDVAGKKRARATGLGQTEAQREATSARQQREIERRIRDLNSDNTRDVNIAIPKREHHGGGGATKAGKTSNTKKILSSGKEFKHYLDDEEAELARTGKIDGLDRDPDAVIVQPVQRASKTPLARRIQREQSSASGSPAPGGESRPQGLTLPFEPDAGAGEDEDEFDGLPSLPTREEMQALLDAPPLTYNAARSAPGPTSIAPRSFCELCGYWGRYNLDIPPDPTIWLWQHPGASQLDSTDDTIRIALHRSVARAGPMLHCILLQLRLSEIYYHCAAAAHTAA